MYAVVGCSECRALWIVEGRSETSQCPRCGSRRKFDHRRKFVETDDENHARDVRASMLAARGGHDDTFADLDSFEEMERQVDGAGMDEREHLTAAGFDGDSVERIEGVATGSAASNASTRTDSRKDIVLNGLRTLDSPSASEVETYAVSRGVPSEYVHKTLTALVRTGEVSENRGQYRLL